MNSRHFILLILIWPPIAFAQADAKNSDKDVLDFNDQLIEGSVLDKRAEVSGARKGSPVFTALGKGDTSMDSIIFKRSDFNDFHETQMRQRVFVQPEDTK